MKRTVIFTLLILLPIIIFAGTGTPLQRLLAGQVPYDALRSYRVSQYIEYAMDGTTWQETMKSIYHYNSNHPTWIDSINALDYNPDTGSYEPALTYVFQYNAAGRVTTMNGYMTFPGFGTINIYRLSCTYDAQNRITHYYMYMIDMMSGLMQPLGRIHFVYSGNRLSELLSWDNLDDKLVEYSKAVLTADTQGRAILQTEQTSPDSSSWVNSSKMETTYHAHDNSNAASLVEYMSGMLPLLMTVSFSMVPGMPALNTSYLWNGSTWVNEEKETYNWNGTTDLLTDVVVDLWSGTDWVPNNRTTYTYDANENVSVAIEQTWMARSWTDEYKYVYTWQSTTANDDPHAPAVSALKLNTYPQPFATNITILPESKVSGSIALDIYNLKGQLIRNLTTLPGVEITWDGMDNHGANCSSGVYYLKASQGNRHSATRIIKMK